MKIEDVEKILDKQNELYRKTIDRIRNLNDKIKKLDNKLKIANKDTTKISYGEYSHIQFHLEMLQDRRKELNLNKDGMCQMRELTFELYKECEDYKEG